jgi:hypothetical protein
VAGAAPAPSAVEILRAQLALPTPVAELSASIEKGYARDLADDRPE